MSASTSRLPHREKNAYLIVDSFKVSVLLIKLHASGAGQCIESCSGTAQGLQIPIYLIFELIVYGKFRSQQLFDTALANTEHQFM